MSVVPSNSSSVSGMTENPAPIFLVGRFRSGTTALWQLFDRLPEYTAWYEPLHPNLPAAIAYTRPQRSHRHVHDYWLPYRGLTDALAQHWRRDFATGRLYLENNSPWPALKAYLDWLIAQSSGTPVIKFTRMDLRLSWLREQFPEARIVSIRRQPQALWHSTRRHLPESEKGNESHPDAYELMQWSNALAADFPFLAPQPGRHGYFRHYALWRLSTSLADALADFSLNLENMTGDVSRLADWLGWSEGDKAVATAGLEPPEPTTGEPDPELLTIEESVNVLLHESGLEQLGRLPLAAIRQAKPGYWENARVNPAALSEEVLRALYAREEEVTRLLHEVSQNSAKGTGEE